jgi:hypothetical protein
MVGDVALISDEEVRKSLFAYELPGGRELFVARNWEQGAVDPKTGTLSFSVPAQANECETSLRAMDVAPPACRKRADEAVQCLRASADRYAKTPAKVEVAAASKTGKNCRFDFLERYRFEASKKVLEPTGEVSVLVSSTL